MTVCFCHVTYAFQSESILHSCLNVKELLARNRREIWSLSDYNWTRTHNHLIRKRTLPASTTDFTIFDFNLDSPVKFVFFSLLIDFPIISFPLSDYILLTILASHYLFKHYLSYLFIWFKLGSHSGNKHRCSTLLPLINYLGTIKASLPNLHCWWWVG